MFEKEVTDLCCSTCKAEVNCKEKCECWHFARKGAEFGYQKGLRAKINTTTISDCHIKDSWHEQDTDDIYDFISKDWSIRYFICIMKDKSRVTATGSCDEACSGEVSVNLVFDYNDEKYSSDDILWWKEIELPEEK